MPPTQVKQVSNLAAVGRRFCSASDDPARHSGTPDADTHDGSQPRRGYPGPGEPMPSTSAAPSPARARARSSTASSMGSVSLPVNVFCWLTW